MKKAPLFLLASATAFVAVLFLKDGLAAGIVQGVGSGILGTRVSVERMRVGVFKSAVVLTGLRIEEPRGFPPGDLGNVEEVRMSYAPSDLLRGKVHITQAEVLVREIVIIRNADGALNVDELTVAKKKSAEIKSGQAPSFKIDSLALTIEKVVYKDLSRGPKPVIEVWNLPIHDKVYSGITRPEELASLVLVEALQSAAIQGALIYGAAAMAGTAILPLGAVMLLAGGDQDMETVRADYGHAVQAASAALKELGDLTLEDREGGLLKAVVNGCEVSLRLEKQGFRKIRIWAQARKLLIPQPRVASGVLYAIMEKLR